MDSFILIVGASVIAVESSYLNLIGHVDRTIVIVRDPYECIRVSYDQRRPQKIPFGTYYIDHSKSEKHDRPYHGNYSYVISL